MKSTYSIDIKNSEIDQFSDYDLKFNINELLFLEALLMIIRDNTIKCSSFKKKIGKRRRKKKKKKKKNRERNTRVRGKSK